MCKSLAAWCFSICLALLAVPAMGAPTPAPGVPTMPKYVLIPSTGTSVPFASVAARGGPARLVARDLAKAGYVEEEYLLTGVANIYTSPDCLCPEAGKTLITPNVPYATRMLVVRPVDPRRWSGDIQLTALRNSTETSEGWALAADYMLEHGDVWVGLTVSKENVETKHRVFDARRYTAINIPDDGFRYDLMAQVAWLMRSPDGLLAKAGYRNPDVKVISSGWSVNGMLQVEMINGGHHARARTPSGGPVIDGYIPAINDEVLEQLPRDAAVIRMNTEEEASTTPLSPRFGGKRALAIRRPDADGPDGRFRLYEIGTTIHLGFNELNRSRWTGDYQLAGGKLWDGWENCKPLPVDTRSGKAHYARAAYANMSDWLHKGVAPPPSRVLRIDSDGVIQRDADGYAEGGLRPYWAAVPRSRVGVIAPVFPPLGGCAGMASEEPFPEARLNQLYPTRQAYLDKVRAYLDQQVKERYLRASDAAEDLARAAQDQP